MASAVTARSVTAPTYLPVGTVVGRKYRIDGILGAGGMGIVYRGWHLVLEQPIAIKVMRAEHSQSPESQQLFLNEARSMAQLRGIHAARVLDVGYLEGGSPYMVLEYLEGCDLRTLLASTGPLPLTQAVEYLLQTCEAIAEAHALGMVHCDLKPDNLFLNQLPDGTSLLKVIDFGIAKRSDWEPDYSRLDWGLGSPQYMAPEQFLSPQTVDARADIWSLGVLLFELLTGSVPFMADSVPRARLRVLCEEPTLLTAFRNDLPAELEGVVQRCLSKSPEDRFATVQELAEALLLFGPDTGIESVRHVRCLLGWIASPSEGLLPVDIEWEEVAPPESGRLPLLAVGAGCQEPGRCTLPGAYEAQSA